MFPVFGTHQGSQQTTGGRMLSLNDTSQSMLLGIHAGGIAPTTCRRANTGIDTVAAMLGEKCDLLFMGM